MKATSALAWAAGSDPLIGAIVASRYRIEESIGAGQMARVYRARHLRLSRCFAVKVLSGANATDPLMRLRFAQEADIASSLDHPNVVSVVDFGRSEGGELYLVMDLIEGESLAQLIAREGPFAPPRAIALTRALARGLGHAHERGLVHRDFKPDNVVLERTASGELLPRILDFGLAIRADPDDGEPRLTEQGFVVGTPLYLAPEQACAEPVDSRADLYALGVVLYEMLAGRPPFDGNAVEVARRKLVEPP
ncbi:MAG TPA: serine/threonine-protein kinase, partial [Kofleriaceae bacterium]